MPTSIAFPGLGELHVLYGGRNWYAYPETILPAHKTRPKYIPEPKACLRTKVEGRAWLEAYAKGRVWWEPHRFGSGGQWEICDEARCIGCGDDDPITEGTYCLQCVKEEEEQEQ